MSCAVRVSLLSVTAVVCRSCSCGAVLQRPITIGAVRDRSVLSIAIGGLFHTLIEFSGSLRTRERSRWLDCRWRSMLIVYRQWPMSVARQSHTTTMPLFRLSSEIDTGELSVAVTRCRWAVLCCGSMSVSRSVMSIGAGGSSVARYVLRCCCQLLQCCSDHLSSVV